MMSEVYCLRQRSYEATKLKVQFVMLCSTHIIPNNGQKNDECVGHSYYLIFIYRETFFLSAKSTFTQWQTNHHSRPNFCHRFSTPSGLAGLVAMGYSILFVLPISFMSYQSCVYIVRTAAHAELVYSILIHNMVKVYIFLYCHHLSVELGWDHQGAMNDCRE